MSAPPELRERLQGRSPAALLERCAGLRPGRDPERAALVLALGTLARRARHLQAEADTLENELTRRVQQLAPTLLARRGVGPISAASLLVAWSTPDGCAPRQPSPGRRRRTDPRKLGKVVRHRLDRGGDRHLNRALHTIVLSLRRVDPQTKAYITRRLSEGKTAREAVRCLKRYLCRSLFREMEAIATG